MTDEANAEAVKLKLLGRALCPECKKEKPKNDVTYTNPDTRVTTPIQCDDCFMKLSVKYVDALALKPG